MNLKKSKEEVAYEASEAAVDALNYGLRDLKYRYATESIDSNLEHMKRTFGHAIQMAIKSMLDNVYTDDDFEKDLTLKP